MPSILQSVAKKKYKMGLQLFTMRADMAKDAIGSLKKIASIGYEDLEIYGYDPHITDSAVYVKKNLSKWLE